MPSDIMNSNQFVRKDQIIKKIIKVARVNNTNSIGARMWFVVQDMDGLMYQRWSLLMDETDATLALLQAGDMIDIEYWVETVSDPVFQRTEEFTRNNLTLVRLRKK
jgi:hypothetical protein